MDEREDLASLKRRDVGDGTVAVEREAGVVLTVAEGNMSREVTVKRACGNGQSPGGLRKC